MKKNSHFSVKTVVAIGIGAALFFVLKRFVAIPAFILPNTNFDISYGFLALMSVLFGPLAGGLIGLIGHTLTDLTYGNPWWGWIIASGLVGVFYGYAGKVLNIDQGEIKRKELVSFNIYQTLGNFVAWLVVAPTLDVLIYKEPIAKVFFQGIFVSISCSIVVGVLGSILIVSYAANRTKKGSLRKE